jgi:predicted metal-dependent peptidase
MMLDLISATDAEAAAKVRDCTVDLLFRSPLFGLTLLGSAVRVKENKKIPTMCTDGRSIWYSPEWVGKKSAPSIMFDLLHELLHVFGNHPARRGTRDERIWGYAVDVRVAHDALAICRVRGPWELDSDHVPALRWAENLSAEQIYEILKREPNRIPQSFESDIQDPEETAEQEQEFKQRFVQDLAQAQIAEERQGSEKSLEDTYGKAIWERLQELKRCEVPWHVLLLGRLCAAVGQERVSWLPPNRKWFPVIALPTRHGTQEDELLLGVDISGSINNDDLARFRACIMPAARRAKRTTVVTFDAEVRECVTTTRPDQVLKDIHFKTGSHSHTSVRGVFDVVEERRPSAIAILTDGYIMLPEKAYPMTHWILKPDGVTQPWGRHYRLHASW